MTSKRPNPTRRSKPAKTPARTPRAVVRKTARRSADETTSKELLLESAAKVGEAELRRVIAEEQAILRKVSGGEPLHRFLADIRTLLSLLRDFSSGAYQAVPLGTIAVVGGALCYLLSPVDLIPDFIPGVGLVDDAAVIAACLKLVAYQVARYEEWKAS